MKGGPLTYIPDQVRLDELGRVYSSFKDIYRTHFEKNFDSIKRHDFKSLKERLLLARHILQKRQDLEPEKCSELVQVIFSEENLHEAQKVLHNSENEKEHGHSLVMKAWRVLQPLFGGKESEEEVLERDMKKIASSISDSLFLSGLKDIEIEDLKPAVQKVETLARASLLVSIDAMVKQVTYDVLHMQQKVCQKAIQKEIQVKEGRELRDSLVNFTRFLNAQLARRKDP